MRFPVFALVAIVMTSLFGCIKEYPEDRQLRFILPGNISYDTSYLISDSINNINSFNIDYYSHIDSIVFSFNASISLNDSATYELYNYTDKIPIPGSTVTVKGQGVETLIPVQVSNLNGAFPHKEISLGIAMKNHVSGTVANIIYPYLYLYRK